MFASLRHWTAQRLPLEEPALEVTLGAMDDAGVRFGLLSAWHGPREGALISNEEVAGLMPARVRNMMRL
jgi:hypothetical protein